MALYPSDQNGGGTLLDEVSFKQGTNYDSTKNIDLSPYKDVFILVGTAKSNDKIQDIRLAQYANKDVMCKGNASTYQALNLMYYYDSSYKLNVIVQFKGNAITRLQGIATWNGDTSTVFYMRVYGIK